MQAQQEGHEEQEDGHYTRIFLLATLLCNLTAMQLEIPGSMSLLEACRDRSPDRKHYNENDQARHSL